MPIYKQRRIADILRLLYPSEYDFGLYDGSGTELVGKDTIFQTMLFNWSTWTFNSPEYYTDIHGSSFPEWFKMAWENYKAQMQPQFAAAWNAMLADYDPIQNYSMYEETADGVKRDKNEATTTPEGTIRNATSRTGLNSVDPVLTDQNETSYINASTTLETLPSNQMPATFDGESSGGYNEVREIKHKRAGNIGVTTSQQMLESEIQLRKQNLIYDYLRGFIAQHCYYGGWED